MKKIVEKSLEAALIKASSELGCSVADLEYEIVQNPSGGFFGIGKKEAIIIVDTKPHTANGHEAPTTSQAHAQNNETSSFSPSKYQNKSGSYEAREARESYKDRRDYQGHKKEHSTQFGQDFEKERQGARVDTRNDVRGDYTKPYASESRHREKGSTEPSQWQDNKWQDNKWQDNRQEKQWQDKWQKAHEPQKAPNPKKSQNLQSLKDPYDSDIWGDESVGSFQNSLQDSQNYGWEKAVRKSSKAPSQGASTHIISADDEANILEIKNEIKALFALLPFEIDRFEVSMEENNTLYVYIDGRDCALLIGERGYRYKALSYLLFNWINPKYGYSLRLEIAEFLKNQEEMIDVYLKDIVRLIKLNGRAQTKTLDGILVYIALTKLREMFPDKYVSVRQNEAMEKYIIINDFRR